MPTILVAEDEPDISNLIAFTLKFGGFEVISTSNGVDAVSHAKEDDPDLIILDVRMPRMTGYEACRKLKADASTADIPVVFLSARGQENEVQAGLEAGGIDYILKPFAPDKLIERVKELLDSHTPGATADKPVSDKPAAKAAASPVGEPPATKRSEAGADEKAEKGGKEAKTPSSTAPRSGPVAGSPTAAKPAEKANGKEQPRQAGAKEDEARPEEAKDGKADD